VSVEPAEGVAFDLSVPVAVIGGGAAGLVAALSVAEAGVEALVIERDPVPRGSTALSAGLVPAAGTRWQREAGVVDSPQSFAADIRAKASGEPDPTVVAAVTTTAGPALEWLADAHALPVSLLTGFRYPGHSADRMHGLPSRSGAELIDRLRTAAEERGIIVLTEAAATTLFADPDGRVHGLAVERPDGGRERLGCEALVLACGGYGGDPDLVRRHIPPLADAPFFGHGGNRGDALRWGAALGGAARHLAGHQGHASVAHPHGILVTWATIAEGGVQVNAVAERFADESRGYSEQAADVLRQPDGLAWTLFDARIAGIARQFEDFRAAEAAGAVAVGPTWEALAERLHLPPAALARTMGEVTRWKRDGGADGFGRSFRGSPPLLPPFHGVRVTGALFHTQGGLVVDGDARVLRPDGAPLQNLWAAGGAACGVSGSDPAGYLSGNGLLTAVALGRIAGRSAARFVGGG
jgi:fumarate reductase flavoprotein subunit